MKYSIRLGENVSDLQKALELMLSVPHRAIDNKFLASIEGFRGMLGTNSIKTKHTHKQINKQTCWPYKNKM